MADLQENQMVQRGAAFLRCIDSEGNSGLVTPISILGYLPYIFKSGGLYGAGAITWMGLGTFRVDPYLPIRIDIIIGTYNSTSRMHINLVINAYYEVYLSGEGYSKIGYVLRDSEIDIYLKILPADSFNGWVYGSFINTIGNTTTEPSNIVYAP